ncbi:type II toxin-antitoxin system RelE/ParE family toxin [methanotrophic endosymbiont of Bathymodiolus puteoserpentis (Logatchev)]|jgi:toxin ParE1/3/4|uniref:type II toxin-antitoxin system RelE/ParE family toxin n=1 Tax=methanotrophic endosymbiont of Bathymodiolus puteoserpentis (Logatchev) TaxID=343235 RepID=UPI0013C5F64E|nr:type II toxin-antitoxin system RelE/ParE family toxin [methanotrophic endosymbiont of Bathymodiolus puteoserpentis (Logatchev)]SHE23285.1 ParE toxin protein [methanotrophic endosymbiont of Bathymodiolus puteoserpentis (Logatchev)]
MSVNPSYTLRLKAQGDLESIWQYSFTTWGSAQADHYLRALVTRFEWLADNPLLGKPRDDIKSGYRCFPEGQHLVFYKITQQQIDIIGVVHQSQDIITLLKN